MGSSSDVLDVITRGTLEVEGRLIEASNATLLADAELDGVAVRCVYKPVRGERPLWDFPGRTLSRREVATYLVSQHCDLPVVPPTGWRDDGPYGAGMVQAWVDSVGVAAEPGAGLIDVVSPGQVPPGWHMVLEAEDHRGADVLLVHADTPELRQMALLDLICNNADRKGGHVLFGRTASDDVEHTYGVDHGLTFNEEEKLRTILWGFAGQRFSAELDASLAVVKDALAQLAGWLAADEIDICHARSERLRAAGRFPRVGPRWPALPWPAF